MPFPSFEDSVWDLLQALSQKVGQLLTKADDLNKLVQDMQAELQANTDTTQSVVTLMTKEHEELLAALGNPDPTAAVAAAQTVLQAFAANRQALADAVAANPEPTPPSPPPTAPTPPTQPSPNPPTTLSPSSSNPTGVQPA